jgi:hypothetical protein
VVYLVSLSSIALLLNVADHHYGVVHHKATSGDYGWRYHCTTSHAPIYQDMFVRQIDWVFRTEGEEFNSTLLRRLTHNPLLGIDVLPDSWRQIKESLLRNLNVDHEDWEWARNEL